MHRRLINVEVKVLHSRSLLVGLVRHITYFVCTPVDWLSMVPSIPWWFLLYRHLKLEGGGKGEAYLRI